MACFADINVSQGSVATYARCDGIFNIHLNINLSRNLPVKKLKSVKIWQNYGHESWPHFFGPPCVASFYDFDLTYGPGDGDDDVVFALRQPTLWTVFLHIVRSQV